MSCADSATLERRMLLRGRIELVRHVASGGMGEVHEAFDHRRGRRVAVKMLRPELAGDPELLLRFEREGRLVREVRHPGVAHVLGLWREDGVPCILMELVEGERLLDRILAAGPMDPEQALRIAREIAGAAAAAHEAGIVHRDLKPENVLLRRSDGRVKVVDFGIARFAHSTLTRAGHVLGTAGYASPEQLRGRRVDRRADVFSLGVILLEMLTGRRAIDGEDTAELRRRTFAGSPLRGARGLRRPLLRLLARLLRKGRRRRPASMAAVIELIDGVRERLRETDGATARGAA